MAQDPIEVKGGAYAEVNKQRCGEVEVVNLDTHNFGPQIPDSARTSARLERYAKRYHLIPLGENNGVWFYRSEWATNQYSVYDSSLEVPQGKFASITISDPMTFSVNRGCNYICQWLTERRIKIKEFPLNGENVVLLLTLCQEDGTECTKMYVPIS